MKRDWDVIRELLTKVEECSLPRDSIGLSSFPPERGIEIAFHMELLFKAGFVDGHMFTETGPGPYDFSARRLTWDENEFLDRIRNDTVWQKTKKVFLSKGISMTFDLVKSVATEVTSTILKASI